jgi:uncharacterized protein with PCYCGC motif
VETERGAPAPLQPTLKSRWLRSLATGTLALLLAACGSAKAPAAIVPDPAFPPAVYSNPAALKAYRIAVRMPGLLAGLPCYCGCGQTLAHQNLRDCFLNSDGTFDEHAATCAVCDMEAADAAQWQAQGNPPAQIWRLIVAKYDSYGPGTNTAQPEK